jgi:hypothetical protein
VVWAPPSGEDRVGGVGGIARGPSAVGRLRVDLVGDLFGKVELADDRVRPVDVCDHVDVHGTAGIPARVDCREDAQAALVGQLRAAQERLVGSDDVARDRVRGDHLPWCHSSRRPKRSGRPSRSSVLSLRSGLAWRWYGPSSCLVSSRHETGLLVNISTRSDSMATVLSRHHDTEGRVPVVS